MSDQQSKLVLLPFGRAWSNNLDSDEFKHLSDRLDGFMRVLAGDGHRYIEGPCSQVESFIQAERFSIERSSRDPGGVIVVLTKTAIFSDVVNMRHEMERLAPELLRAIWIVYDKLTAGFVRDLQALGKLEKDEVVTHVPIWTVGTQQFLVLTPDCGDLSHLRQQVKMLIDQMDPARPSDRSSASQSSMRAVTPPPDSPPEASVHNLPTVRPSSGSMNAVTPAPSSGPRPKSSR